MEGNEVRHLLATNIKRLRENHKMSQAELAFEANISIPFLSDIERANKWPHPDTLAKIATVFNVPVHQLFLFTEVHSDTNILCKSIIDELIKAQNDATKNIYNQYFENKSYKS